MKSMRRLGTAVTAAGLLVGFWFAGSALEAGARAEHRAPIGGSRAEVPTEVVRRGAAGRIPLGFEANVGQTSAEFEFLARARNYHAFLAHGDVVLRLPTTRVPDRKERLDPDFVPPEPTSDLVRMCVDRNLRPEGRSRGQLPGKVNYLIGNDAANWRTGIARHGEVHYDDVRPGVDLVFRGDRRRLRFDFVVEPGTDPATIGLTFDGAGKATIADDGSLRIPTPNGHLRLTAPVTYQVSGATRLPVASVFRLTADGGVGFRVPKYDRTKPLVIDPTIEYASYLGGGGLEHATQVAVSAAGRVFVAGYSESTDLPTTTGSFQPSKAQDNGNSDTFVAKFSDDGSDLVFATYIGGDVYDIPNSLRVDESENVFLCGDTRSDNFPTVGAFESTRTTLRTPTYLLKLDASGSSLAYSTYFNAGHYSQMGIDANGNAIIMLRLLPGLQVIKVNAAGTSKIYDVSFETTVSGGPVPLGLDVDTDGNAYLSGTTQDTQFMTTTGAFQQQHGGATDVWVRKLNGSGGIVYSTLLGGTSNDYVRDMTVSEEGEVILVGSTGSHDFPVASAYDGTLSPGADDAFVSRLSADGSSLVMSTYFGGPQDDGATGVASVGEAIYVVGTAYDEDGNGISLPLVTPIEGTPSGSDDSFLAVFACGGDLEYASYIGGQDRDWARDVAISQVDDDVVVVMGSDSDDLATTQGAVQSQHDQDFDGYVVRFSGVHTPLRIQTDKIFDWTITRPGTFQLLHTGGDVDWSVDSGSLPPGLTLGTDGEIDGTATKTGTFSMTLAANHVCGAVLKRDFLITVNALPAITPPSGLLWTVGAGPKYDLELTGGTEPLNVEPVDPSSLPPWLSLSSGGELTGTASSAGVTSFDVRVTDARGAVATRRVRVTVNPVASFRTTPFSTCTEGTAFEDSFGLIEGTPPFTWSVVSGTIPTFEDLDDAAGKLDGFLRPAGPYNFTVRVVDSLGIAVEQGFVVNVNPEPAVATSTFPLAAAGRPYTATSASTGGTLPLAWTAEGTTPGGVSVARADGVWSGTPETAGAFDFNLVVRDACGALHRRPLTIDVARPLAIEKKKAKYSEDVTFITSRDARVFFLELLAGTEVSFKLKLKGKSDLTLTPRLLDAEENAVSLAPYMKQKSRAITVKGLPITRTGRYFLRLDTDLAFQGKLGLVVKAPPRSSWSGTANLEASGGTQDVVISAPPGSTLTFKVKAAKKSAALPTIVSVLEDGSTELLDVGTLKTKGKSASWKLKQPTDGTQLRLRLSNTADAAGDVDWKAKVKLPKVNTFDLADVPAGVGVSTDD